MVHTEDVDVPGDAPGLHHLAQQLPGDLAPAVDDGEVEGGLASEREAQVEAGGRQLSDLGAGARADSQVQCGQLSVANISL